MVKNNFDLMTIEEEREIFQKIEHFKENGIELENNLEYQEIVTRLYEINERLMYKVATKFSVGKYSTISRDDLVCSSYDAFLNAINKFSYKKEVRFSTFLYRAVFDSMRRYIQKYGRGVTVPIRIQERYSKILRCEAELRCELGRDPDLNDLALKTGFTVEDIMDVKYCMGPIYCLDNTMNDSLKNYLDILVDPNGQAVN